MGCNGHSDSDHPDADRVHNGRYADGVRKGKWKRRAYVARSETHEGTDLRPIDVQQGTFSELLDNTVPFDPLNPCFSVRAGVDDDDDDLSEDELARVIQTTPSLILTTSKEFITSHLLLTQMRKFLRHRIIPKTMLMEMVTMMETQRVATKLMAQRLLASRTIQVSCTSEMSMWMVVVAT